MEMEQDLGLNLIFSLFVFYRKKKKRLPLFLEKQNFKKVFKK